MNFNEIKGLLLTKVEEVAVHFDGEDTWFIIDTIHDEYKAVFIVPFDSKQKLAQDQNIFIPMTWDVNYSRPINVLPVQNLSNFKQFIKEKLQSLLKFPALSPIQPSYIAYVLSHKKYAYNTFAASLLKQIGKLTEKQMNYIVRQNNSSNNNLEKYLLQSNPEFIKEYINEISERYVSIPEEIIINEVQKDEITLEGIFFHSVDTTVTYPTKNYTDFAYKFDSFNPVQSEVLKYKELDSNVVIAASTSAGKTISAEIIMDESLKIGKVIYLSPLKSLTQEKYTDWSTRYKDKKIAILTGDYVLSEQTKKELDKADIICMTSEMLDSRSRRMDTEGNQWLYSVSLLVVDEFHIAGTSRGHSLESGLMRFTKMNPRARVVCLSATVPNVEDFALWLKVLNGKRVDVIQSNWRPVELEFNYVTFDDTIVYNYADKQKQKVQAVVDVVMKKHDEQFLIFCHDKNTIKNVVMALKDVGIKSMNHSADLSLKKRMETEAAFEKGKINILVSTSTLAWGRNLPAKNVIITGVHRGINEVEVLDIIQMSGRAGRMLPPKYIIQTDDKPSDPIKGIYTAKSIEGTPKKVIDITK